MLGHKELLQLVQLWQMLLQKNVATALIQLLEFQSMEFSLQMRLQANLGVKSQYTGMSTVAPGKGSLSNKYGQVSGKRVAIVDDVLSTGVTMSRTIEAMRDAGAEVALCMVLVNKTVRNEIDEVPLRGIIRAAVV